MLAKIRAAFAAVLAWLTEPRRQAIYLVLSTTATSLVTFGVMTDSEAEQYIKLGALALQGLVLLLQLVNMSAATLGNWFTTKGRTILYSGAVALAGIGVALGWFPDSAAAQTLTIVSVVLTNIGAVVSVLQIGSGLTQAK